MKKLLAVALCAALMLVGVGALADYPEKPVECMVQWAAGGGADLAFRALAEVFPKYANGQQIVIKNEMCIRDSALCRADRHDGTGRVFFHGQHALGGGGGMRGRSVGV